MAVLIAAGTAAANSADLVVAAGKSVILSLFDADGNNIVLGASVLIQKKAGNGTYTVIDSLDSTNPAKVFTNPTGSSITLRAARLAGPNYGVEVDA